MYEVIAEFVDKNTGARIRPGQPLPETMDRDQLGRLLRAKCLRRLPDQPGLLGKVLIEAFDDAASKATTKTSRKKATTKRSNPKAAAGEVGHCRPGFLPEDDTPPVAGRDGDDPGQRGKSGGRGRKRSKG